MSTWSSTGEVEQGYSRVRLISQGIKSSTTTERTFEQLKVLLDAPEPDQLVQVDHIDGRAVYKTTCEGNMIMAAYRRLFNGHNNVKNTDLPRRILGDRKRKKGLRAFERERHSERTSCSDMVSGVAAAALETILNEAAEARQTEDQRKLLRKLQLLQKRKANIFQHDTPRQVQQKLREHEQARTVRTENVAALELRSLTDDVATLHGRATIIFVGSRNQKSSATLQALAEIPDVDVQTYDEAMGGLTRLLSGESHIIWLFPTADKMCAFVDPLGVGASIHHAEAGSDKEKQAIASACRQIAPRMIGGHVAGPSFLQRQLAPENRMMLRKPILALEPGLWQNLELMLHETKLSAAVKNVIASIHLASHQSPQGQLVQWSVKRPGDDLRLGLNQKHKEGSFVQARD